MATPWNRAADRYVTEWMPRFRPYHLDLVRELALEEGQRVLVTTSGPGAEVLALAHAVGGPGHVRSTDMASGMVDYCAGAVQSAGFQDRVACAVADAADTTGGPWDAIVCAFGLWQIENRDETLASWTKGLATGGKIGILISGPPDADDVFESLNEVLRELEPHYPRPKTRILAERDSLQKMLSAAGLSIVRLTVVRHTMTFKSLEAFVDAMKEGCTWRRIADQLGEERAHRVALRFYEKMGGDPTMPLSFRPPSTIVIAARPGDDVRLEGRPSVRVPSMTNEG
jgi:ubiquinone/menaquinone biosynthesis C-methylase UbiE